MKTLLSLILVVLRSAITLGSRVAYLYLLSGQMHFSIHFGQERRETLEIRNKVKEFPSTVVELASNIN